MSASAFTEAAMNIVVLVASDPIIVIAVELENIKRGDNNLQNGTNSRQENPDTNHETTILLCVPRSQVKDTQERALARWNKDNSLAIRYELPSHAFINPAISAHARLIIAQEEAEARAEARQAIRDTETRKQRRAREHRERRARAREDRDCARRNAPVPVHRSTENIKKTSMKAIKDLVSSTTPSAKRRKTQSFKAVADYMGWPEDKVPVEIFTMILRHLPRSDVQNMRLVNKEFERKVSHELFKIVVVPFRPEIYGIAADTGNDGAASSVMLQDKGMRVFQGFGRWIQKFAMSFEIDADRLSKPPIKNDQEAIVSFWGIYRWPFKNYNRYTQLEGLEQTADETRSMAKALRYITNAQELGLSIDVGLGWMAGPDKNKRVENRCEKLKVFGGSTFKPETQQYNLERKLMKSFKSKALQPGGLRTAFENMLRVAGYSTEDMDSTIAIMIENEDFGDESDWEAGDWESLMQRSSSVDSPANRQPEPGQVRYVSSRRRGPRLELTRLGADAATNDATFGTSDIEEDDDANDPLTPAVAFQGKTKPKAPEYPLKPNDLSTPQREMILEMEWAQAAFMQSYVIAIIDNKATFENIKSFTIARLPSCYLAIVRRGDFWDSLPNVSSVSLGVIPDWRKVLKEDTAWVSDTRVAPSLAVDAAHLFLAAQIAPREHIKSLHFEWLCGGEYAVGEFARNQHILPAPVVSQASYMVNRAVEHPILGFPHLESLSLKNCYFSPHIMMSFMESLRASGVQRLSFDSVSLTARINPGAQPVPQTAAAAAAAVNQAANQAALNQLAQNMMGQAQQVGQAGQVGPAVLGAFPNAIQAPAQPAATQPATAVSEDQWAQPPRLGSWTELLDKFTPGTNLADIRYSRDTLGPAPEARPESRISKIELNSCGYVRLPLDFNQQAVDPQHGGHTTTFSPTSRRGQDIETHMMKSQDSNLAVILNNINRLEAATLEHGFNMTTHWGPERRELREDARSDSVTRAGEGRVSGVVNE